jgi:hypothetical protein
MGYMNPIKQIPTDIFGRKFILSNKKEAPEIGKAIYLSMVEWLEGLVNLEIQPESVIHNAKRELQGLVRLQKQCKEIIRSESISKEDRSRWERLDKFMDELVQERKNICS